MAYTYSKTNWKDSDTFEVTDWIRIRDNYNQLYVDLKNILYMDTDLQPDISEFTSTLQKPYYDDVNTLEENILFLYLYLGIPFEEWLPIKIWTYRTSSTYQLVGNPSYHDWNRWEMLIANVHSAIEYWKTPKYQVVSGMSYSGTNRRVQTLSRGR